MECVATVQELIDRNCWEAVCDKRGWNRYWLCHHRRGKDVPLTFSEAEARECGLIGPPPNAPPPEVTIETVRAAAREPGIEPNWKEAYEELYRSFQERLTQQEAFTEKLMNFARAQGQFNHGLVSVIEAGDDPPANLADLPSTN